MIPTKFQFIWPSGYREEDFLEIKRLSDCPGQGETSVGQVKFVGHLSVGTSKKKKHTEIP
jgi:hypothetical protein